MLQSRSQHLVQSGAIFREGCIRRDQIVLGDCEIAFLLEN
jgi:hypothetical protein